jgi:hypothetical protein
VLSKAAIGSAWVMREISWADEAAKRESDFHIIVLKLDESDVPIGNASYASVIDCRGLHRGVGISEELYAAIYRRKGRRQSLTDARFQSLLSDDELGLKVEDFDADCGRALQFSWRVDGESGISWTLTYQHVARVEKLQGAGLSEPVDLDIAPGDLIAWHNCHRRLGVHYGRASRLAMRSNRLELTPDAVLQRYYAVTFAQCPNLRYESKSLVIVPHGEDSFGRLLSSVMCECQDGQLRHVDELLFYGVSSDGIDGSPVATL